MAKSIMQKYTDSWNRECYFCRKEAESAGYYGELTHSSLDRHHIFYGTANRQKSEHYGLWVYLCKDHHLNGPKAVHINQESDLILKRDGQAAFERLHGHELFMREFGKNYLEEENDGYVYEFYDQYGL